jgi:hypothetical protein
MVIKDSVECVIVKVLDMGVVLVTRVVEEIALK